METHVFYSLASNTISEVALEYILKISDHFRLFEKVFVNILVHLVVA